MIRIDMLESKVVVVTKAGGGIGRDIALSPNSVPCHDSYGTCI